MDAKTVASPPLSGCCCECLERVWRVERGEREAGKGRKSAERFFFFQALTRSVSISQKSRGVRRPCGASEDERFESDRLGSRRSGLTSEVPRTLVMSVRYALRISVDDATEETPSAAYRSGSPEAVESGAAGIVAEAVLDERSRQKARGMCRRRASGRGYGGRIRGRTFRTEGRVAGVVAVVRDARRRVRRVRRSDTTRCDATRRWEDAAEENAGEENRRRTGETARPGTTRSRRSERNRRVSPAFWVNGVPLRDSFSFFRVPAWRHEKRRRKTQSCCASARHFAETSARARF